LRLEDVALLKSAPSFVVSIRAAHGGEALSIFTREQVQEASTAILTILQEKQDSEMKQLSEVILTEVTTPRYLKVAGDGYCPYTLYVLPVL